MAYPPPKVNSPIFSILINNSHSDFNRPAAFRFSSFIAYLPYPYKRNLLFNTSPFSYDDVDVFRPINNDCANVRVQSCANALNRRACA